MSVEMATLRVGIQILLNQGFSFEKIRNLISSDDTGHTIIRDLESYGILPPGEEGSKFVVPGGAAAGAGGPSVGGRRKANTRRSRKGRKATRHTRK